MPPQELDLHKSLDLQKRALPGALALQVLGHQVLVAWQDHLAQAQIVVAPLCLLLQ